MDKQTQQNTSPSSSRPIFAERFCFRSRMPQKCITFDRASNMKLSKVNIPWLLLTQRLKLKT